MANETEVQSYVIPNLVQGVSQQASQNRRDTQCESQFDCINSPVNGCEPRPGFDFQTVLVDADYTDAFFYEIRRGLEEHYLVVINGGAVEAFALHDQGSACDITIVGDADDYLPTTDPAKLVYRAATLEDDTFLVNREIFPAIDAANLAPAARNEAIVYFKAGGYSITFQAMVQYDGHLYTYTYVTPDNSVAGNAAYISTNQIAATFYRAFTGLAASPLVDGTPSGGGNIARVGPGGAGQTTGATAGTDLLSLGFHVDLSGNSILIYRDDDAPFSVDTADGVGDTYMHAVKDTAQSFDELPKNAFEGFTTRVKGANKAEADDYWVTYKDGDGSQGYWEETVAPGTPLTFDQTTMPVILVNTGPSTFELRYVDWGIRVSGDGITKSKDPSFVGKPIEDIFYDNNRLTILTEGACTWSKTFDPFTFFPDSAQTILDTDPIDTKVGGGKQIVLLRKAVQHDEATFLWGQKAQMRSSAANGEAFKQTSIQNKKSTSFEFVERADPLGVGDSLYFATEPGTFATIRDLTVRDGKPQGFADITGHVKRYIPSGVTFLTASDTLGLMLVLTEGDPTKMFAYNFLIGDNDQGAASRLQSAWNTWRLPDMGQMLWASISSNLVNAAFQRPEGVVLLTMDLSLDLKDPGHDDYLTRLDLKVTEDNCTLTYDADEDTTDIVLPFDLLEAEDDDTLEPADQRCLVTNRTTSSDFFRGRLWEVVQVVGNTVTVTGDATAQELYIGLRIRSERSESRFYQRGPQGLVPAQRLSIQEMVVHFSESGYFRVEVALPNRDLPYTYHMSGRVFGEPSNLLGSYPIEEGQYRVPVASESRAVTITLINDSFLPSRWQALEYQFMAAYLARPGQAGGRAK